MDYAARYRIAVALPSIETQHIAEASVELFSRVKVSDEMLISLGSHFTYKVIKEVSRLLLLQHLTTTSHHHTCNGLVECFRTTLKQMLCRMLTERPIN